MFNNIRIEFGNKRNGITKKYYIDENGECVGATCCDCKEVKLVSSMCKSKNKKYGIDSRCISCMRKYFKENKERFKKIDFGRKIEKYMSKGNNEKNLYIKRGKTKNGYSRVIVKRKDNDEIVALSCCVCKKIKGVGCFSEKGATDSTNLRGNCKKCAS